MKTLLLSLLLACGASAATPPIILPKGPAGYALELDRLPLPGGRPPEDAKLEHEAILTIRLLAPDPAKDTAPLILPLRFTPESGVGEVPTTWSEHGLGVAFLLRSYVEGKEDDDRLFVFAVREGKLQPVALPDLCTHLTTKRRDFASLSIYYRADDCFGWVGDNLLLVQFGGSCQLENDAGGREQRELSGIAVFQMAKDATIKFREILNLKIQG